MTHISAHVGRGKMPRWWD